MAHSSGLGTLLGLFARVAALGGVAGTVIALTRRTTTAADSSSCRTVIANVPVRVVDGQVTTA